MKPLCFNYTVMLSLLWKYVCFLAYKDISANNAHLLGRVLFCNIYIVFVSYCDFTF